MLRTKKKQLNLKPNRQLDKRSSRGMLYENEELRLRTIHINDEVDKGQTDIKKLRKENEYLKREIWSLRDECSKLEDVLKKVYSGNPPPLSELPTYQPRVRKQSTFSGMWGGGRRGSNMSFSNCSSYDYEIENDTDNLNQENENDPDMNNYELGQDQPLIRGDEDSLEHSKKPASRQNSSQQMQQQENGGGLTTHVNWEDQQEVHQLDVYLVPGQQSDDGDAHSLGLENSENQQQQQDYCLNQHVVLTHQNQHQHHNHNNHNLWQMHSPDLEAVTEESENASNSNNSNSNSNSNPAMASHGPLHNNIPNYQSDISVSNSNINNFGLTVNSSSVLGGNNFICIDHIDMDHTNSDNDSALFEALAFESMNCSLEHIDNYNQMDQQAFPVLGVTNNTGFLNVELMPVHASGSNSACNNNYSRPIVQIEITPARSSPTSTTASSGNGVGRRSSTATPPSKQFQAQDLDEREREERERSNSSASATGSGSGSGSGAGGDPGLSNNNNSANTNSNQNQNQDHHLHHQTYPGSISASAGADFRDDVYHNLGCVTEIPKKYQVTSELKINVSRTNSSSSLVEQISSASSAPGLLPDDGHTNSGSGGSVGCSSAGASAADNNKKTDQVSCSTTSSGVQPQQDQLRYHPVLNKPSNCSTINGSTVTTITSSSATGDESYRLSQVRQNQFTTHNQSSVFYNHDRERDLAEAETNPVATKSSINNNSSVSGPGSGSGSGGASYRVLKIYSTYLSKTQQKTKRRPSSSSCSNNNNTDSQSFSQSEPNLNSQDIFQFGTSSQPPPFGHRHGYEDEGPMSDVEVGGGGWGPRNGQLTCRKLQGWSRSCCHTNSVVCSCHANSRTNLNPFEMCSCNCASENPHINLKDDWNVFDRNIVIGLLTDEGRDRDNNKDILYTSPNPPVSFRYLSVQEVIDELESQFDSTLENTQGVRLLTLPDFHPCRIFISVRNAGSVRTLIERGLTVRGQRMRLIDASQNAFSFIILSGLPSSFPDSSIISVLNEFGQVVAPLQRRVYKGVDTTERIARMHLVRIPPTSQIPLNIAGFEVLAKFVSQSQNPPSHEIPMSSSSVLSTANDMISTHAVLTCTSSSGSNAGDISTTVGSASAPTASGATPVPAGMNSAHKNYNSSLPTPTTTTVESGPGPGPGVIQRGNKSSVPPALAIGPHGAGPVPVPGPGSASPTMSTIPRPHKPVTRSTTLDSALAASIGHPGGSSLQLQNNFQVQPPTNTNSRFGLGPTAAAISKRNMSICGSLLDCPAVSTTAENGNGQKNGLLGNPKKPLSRLLRSSPGSLVPPSPGPGPGGGMQLLGGDGSGLIAGGAGAGAGRPLSRSMSFEPRRLSGNGKALAVGSQLSLVDSHKLNNQGGSTGNFPLNDSIGSGNGLSRQQSRIFQQHRKLSQASSAHFRNSIDKTKEELPWCGCWGNGCI